MTEARPMSSMQGVSHVPEFVGITRDIDRDDAAMPNLQGSGLENVAPLDGDEPLQAVEKAIAHEARPAHCKDRRERREQPDDGVEPGDRRQPPMSSEDSGRFTSVIVVKFIIVRLGLVDFNSLHHAHFLMIHHVAVDHIDAGKIKKA
jgi:hypothetical protein